MASNPSEGAGTSSATCSPWHVAEDASQGVEGTVPRRPSRGTAALYVHSQLLRAGADVGQKHDDSRLLRLGRVEAGTAAVGVVRRAVHRRRPALVRQSRI